MENQQDQSCTNCDRPIGAGVVWLELNTRTLGWHTPGSVPEDESQGCFPFGPDCARAALERTESGHEGPIEVQKEIPVPPGEVIPERGVMTEVERLRLLMAAYIRHVGWIEGIDFLDEPSDYLTEAQRIELIAMRDRVGRDESCSACGRGPSGFKDCTAGDLCPRRL